jgi:hypothetical protein
VEQLVGRQLTVEDVAADKPQLGLHLVGPQHLAVDDGIAEVRCELQFDGERMRRMLLDQAMLRLEFTLHEPPPAASGG